MMSNLERLVYMANQIARNFEAQGHDNAIAATAEHIGSFWDPRMRSLIYQRLDQPDHGLGSTAEAAIRSLRDHAASRAA